MTFDKVFTVGKRHVTSVILKGWEACMWNFYTTSQFNFAVHMN